MRICCDSFKTKDIQNSKTALLKNDLFNCKRSVSIPKLKFFKISVSQSTQMNVRQFKTASFNNSRLARSTPCGTFKIKINDSTKL